MSHDAASGSKVSDERVLVLDFGGQYAQLIARRVREQNVYCEIVRHDISPPQLLGHRRVDLGGPLDVPGGARSLECGGSASGVL